MRQKHDAKSDQGEIGICGCAREALRASYHFNDAENEWREADRELRRQFNRLHSMVARLMSKEVPPEDVLGVATALFCAHRQIKEREQMVGAYMRECQAADATRARLDQQKAEAGRKA